MIAAAVAAVSLSVSPERVRLGSSASRALTITNNGGGPAIVDARPAGLGLDRRGWPAVARGAAAGWLRLRPSRLVLAPGGTAVVTVSSAVPAGAAPGDHGALVLLTTQPPPSAAIAVRMRIGVVVFVRVAGRVVHRLAIGPLGRRGRVLEAHLVNRGNVVERRRVRISLSRRGRLLARLGSHRPTLLPHSHGVQRFRCPDRLRGWLTATVDVGVLRRTFRVRL